MSITIQNLMSFAQEAMAKLDELEKKIEYSKSKVSIIRGSTPSNPPEDSGPTNVWYTLRTMSVSSGVVTKSTTNAWDSGAQNDQVVTADSILDFTFDNAGGVDQMAGFNQTTMGTGTPNFSELDFAWYLDSGDNLNYYEAGQNRGIAAFTHQAGNVYRIESVARNVSLQCKRVGEMSFTTYHTFASTMTEAVDYFVQVTQYTLGCQASNFVLDGLPLDGDGTPQP